MKTHPRPGRGGFTLIELMTVITLIIILAGLVVGGMTFVNQKQQREKARVQVALLEKAIEEYKSDMGAYPGTSTDFGGAEATGADGDYSQVLYTALFYEGFDYSKNPSSTTATKATKIYLPELDPINSKQGWTKVKSGNTPTSDLKITDPWGNNYLYRVGTLSTGVSNGNAQNPDFDIWSKGKDGKTNNANPSHQDCKDDVRNF